jgi:ABC-type proline/glycine betaine transport system substrate-binding protein
MIPNSGKRIRGRSAVTAIAVPSPIHQQAIKTMTAKNRFPGKVIPSGSGINKTIENNIKPPTSTKILLLNKGGKSVNTSSLHGKARSYSSFILLTYFPFT